MTLEDLTPLSDSFFEDEEAALERLPRNRDGLKELLSYLDAFDSLPGYAILFSEFAAFMSEEESIQMKNRAKKVFDLSMLLEEDGE